MIRLQLTNFLRRFRRIVLGLRNKQLMRMRAIRDRARGKPKVIILSLDKLGPSHEVTKQAFFKGFWVHVFAPSFPVLEAAYAHDWTMVDPRTDFDKA